MQQISKAEVEEFVRESEAVSGIVRDLTDADEKYKFNLHVSVATSLFTASNFVLVDIVNSELLGKRKRSEFLRTGNIGAMRGDIPDGRHVGDMLTGWTEEAKAGFDAASSARRYTPEEAEEFAWLKHDQLICIHGFKSANGRTARLMLNHLRIRFGLPLQVISLAESEEYFERIQAFRHNAFMPEYRQRTQENCKAAAAA